MKYYLNLKKGGLILQNRNSLNHNQIRLNRHRVTPKIGGSKQITHGMGALSINSVSSAASSSVKKLSRPLKFKF